MDPPFESALLTRCSLIAGILMTHRTADSLTLWTSPLTDAHLWTAAAYYSLLSKNERLYGCGDSRHRHGRFYGLGAIIPRWSSGEFDV
jgi:uncharacterized protein YhbP (UPF0306 family)